MKNVAITGAAGFLGKKILDRLQEYSGIDTIVATDIKELPDKYYSDRIKFYRLDIRDKRLGELFREHNVDTVIHLAFILDPIRQLDEMRSVNLEGSKNVLDSVRFCGANHLVVASSTSAFGAFPDNPEWLTEETPVREHPTFNYAADKYAVEQILNDFIVENPRIKTAIIRPCIVYGPNVDNYISRMMRNWPFLVRVGRDCPPMQFVHEDDVAELFLLVLEREEEGIFHCVGEGVVTMYDIAAKAGKKVIPLPVWLAYPFTALLYFLRIPLVEAPAPFLDFLRYRWTASDLETRRKTGFKPRYSSEKVVEILFEQ